MKSIKIMLTAIALMILIAILGIGMLIGGDKGFETLFYTAMWLFLLVAMIAVIGLFRK